MVHTTKEQELLQAIKADIARKQGFVNKMEQGEPLTAQEAEEVSRTTSLSAMKPRGC